MDIIIHFTDKHEIKIENVGKREVNSKTYKVFSENKTYTYNMSKISFVEVKEK